MELAQVLMFAGDFLAAQNALFECLLHNKSTLAPDDAELLDARLCQTKVLIFEAKCRQKFSTKTHLLDEFDLINDQIPDSCPSLRASIYFAMGQFLLQSGNSEEASSYLSRANTLRKDEDVGGSGEEEEENEEATDELDTRPPKAILRECIELARLRNSDQEIEKDRDKEKNGHGETRLHIAARSNDIAMVEKLIAAVSYLQTDCSTNKKGQTELIMQIGHEALQCTISS
ncbi:unnamed protein product [Strongylus vulgaris]|uniref:Uncharacterized protein n=1 Tax=Strongylus vulgaris TaxID=40348 RepID=A0A3P7ITI2_STRVU|nr:unnamed protein product [Strongylus vulgaris]